MTSRILVVDNEQEICWIIRKNLERAGYAVDEADCGEKAVEMATAANYRLAILDYKMPGMDGLAALAELKRNSPGTRVIFMTAFGDDDLAMRTLELGADDFIHKPFDIKNLLFRVRKTLAFHEMQAEVENLRKRVIESKGVFIAGCDKMREALRIVGKVAGSNSSVLVCGETGAGKEHIAHAIHNSDNNPRRGKPFIIVNSAAVPDSLIESELFGHVKGAFTGAVENRRGYFEAADGGTLFLDEISSAPHSLQMKLLRVLDSGEYMRVGETKTRVADVRVLAATNRDLADEVRKGRFRDDLYHRLNALRIAIPPVRERGEDIKALLAHFLAHFNMEAGRNVAFAPDAEKLLLEYSWPGNVRELKHCVASLALMSDSNTITADSLPDSIKNRAAQPEMDDGGHAGFAELKEHTVKNFEKKYFENLLHRTGGNVSKAARMAGMNRAYLSRKMKEHGISHDD